MENNNSFFGTGWSFPPTFLNKGEQVEMVSAEDDIRQSLQIILTTILGERTMHTNFGCKLSQYVFEEIDYGLLTGLKNLISDTILNHETRVKTEDVMVSESQDEPGLLTISVEYTIRSTNTRYNLVFPYYLNEATNPGFLLPDNP